MNQPALWGKYRPHVAIMTELLNEFKNRFNWRADGKDSVMDIGCADGSVTMEIIRSIMPSNFDRLIGVDVSRSMIDYAQKMYSQPNVEFKTFDIVTGDPNELPQVDHITSLYVFHFLHDHEKALSNIYNLLKPGGNCLIILIPGVLHYPVYEQLARYPKWSRYIKDVNNVIPPSQYSKNPEFDFEQLLKKCNFSRVEISTREHLIEFGDMKKFKNYFKTMDPFYRDVPLVEYDAFTSNFAELAVNVFNSAANIEDRNNVYLPVRNLIAYAKK